MHRFFTLILRRLSFRKYALKQATYVELAYDEKTIHLKTALKKAPFMLGAIREFTKHSFCSL
jgi:hypothetical protein